MPLRPPVNDASARRRRGSPDLIELLRSQHDELSRLVAGLQTAKSLAGRQRQAKRLYRHLSAHSQLERERLYPACESASMLVDERIKYLEARELNTLLEKEAHRLCNEPTLEGSLAHAKLLSRLLATHIATLNADLFPQARRVLGRAALVALEREPGLLARARSAAADDEPSEPVQRVAPTA